MPRRKSAADLPPAQPMPPPWHRQLLRYWLWPFAATVAAAGVLFAALLVLDDFARARNLEDERYQVSFADIECNPPPGMSRTEFLDEVQYYDRSVAARFSLLEPQLEAKLATAFSRHPWVYLTTVELNRPHYVRVKLTYRQPVLAVVVSPTSTATDEAKSRAVRAIDGSGFILPKKAPIPPGTVVLVHAPQPKSAEGHKWGDQLVEYAAMMLTCLDGLETHPLAALQLTHMECTADGLVLWGKGIKVLWGKGDKTEPDLRTKAERVLAAKEQSALLTSWMPVVLEIDVRPTERATTRFLPRE